MVSPCEITRYSNYHVYGTVIARGYYRHDITWLVYDIICVLPLLSFFLMGYFPGPHQTWPWSKAWICYSYVFCWWSIYLSLSWGHHRRFIGNYRELISIEWGFYRGLIIYKGTIWNYKGYIYIGNMIGTILGIYLLSPVIKHAWLGNLWTNELFVEASMIDLLTLGMFNMKLVTNSGQKAIIRDDDFVQINLLGISGKSSKWSKH